MSDINNDSSGIDKIIHSLQKIEKERTDIKILMNYFESTQFMKKLVDSKLDKTNIKNMIHFLALNAKLENHPKDSTLFRIGDKGEKFYIILAGKVSVLKPKQVPKFLSIRDYLMILNKLKLTDEQYLYEKIVNCNYEKFIIKERLFKPLMDILYKIIKLEDAGIYEITEDHFLFDKNEKDYKDLWEYINIIKENKKFQFFLEEYEKIIELNAGFSFGDFALESTNRLRTATIKMETNCIFAVIMQKEYSDCLLSEKKNSKMKEFKFLFESFFYKSFDKEKFEKHYFFEFVYQEYFRGSFLDFNSNDNINNNKSINDSNKVFKKNQFPNILRCLYIIKEGQVEITFNKSLLELNELIKFYIDCDTSLKSVGDISNYEDYFSKKLKNNFKDLIQKRNFSIIKVGQNDILGLEEFYFRLPFFFNVKVVSEKLSLYKLNEEGFMKIIEKEGVSKKFMHEHALIKLSNKISRLINLKNTYQRFLEKEVDISCITKNTHNCSNVLESKNKILKIYNAETKLVSVSETERMSNQKLKQIDSKIHHLPFSVSDTAVNKFKKKNEKVFHSSSMNAFSNKTEVVTPFDLDSVSYRKYFDEVSSSEQKYTNPDLVDLKSKSQPSNNVFNNINKKSIILDYNNNPYFSLNYLNNNPTNKIRKYQEIESNILGTKDGIIHTENFERMQIELKNVNLNSLKNKSRNSFIKKEISDNDSDRARKNLNQGCRNSVDVKKITPSLFINLDDKSSKFKNYKNEERLKNLNESNVSKDDIIGNKKNNKELDIPIFSTNDFDTNAYSNEISNKINTLSNNINSESQNTKNNNDDRKKIFIRKKSIVFDSDCSKFSRIQQTLNITENIVIPDKKRKHSNYKIPIINNEVSIDKDSLLTMNVTSNHDTQEPIKEYNLKLGLTNFLKKFDYKKVKNEHSKVSKISQIPNDYKSHGLILNYLGSNKIENKKKSEELKDFNNEKMIEKSKCVKFNNHDLIQKGDLSIKKYTSKKFFNITEDKKKENNHISKYNVYQSNIELDEEARLINKPDKNLIKTKNNKVNECTLGTTNNSDVIRNCLEKSRNNPIKRSLTNDLNYNKYLTDENIYCKSLEDYNFENNNNKEHDKHYKYSLISNESSGKKYNLNFNLFLNLNLNTNSDEIDNKPKDIQTYKYKGSKYLDKNKNITERDLKIYKIKNKSLMNVVNRESDNIRKFIKDIHKHDEIKKLNLPIPGDFSSERIYDCRNFEVSPEIRTSPYFNSKKKSYREKNISNNNITCLYPKQFEENNNSSTYSVISKNNYNYQFDNPISIDDNKNTLMNESKSFDYSNVVIALPKINNKREDSEDNFYIDRILSCLKTENFLNEPELTRELINRMSYYSTLINELHLGDTIQVQIKDNKVILTPLKEILPANPIFYLSKSLIFSSCDIFPFREIIMEVTNQLTLTSSVDLNKFISPIVLTYNLMYLNHANKEKAFEYYKDFFNIKDDDERISELDSIMNFTPSQEIKAYLDNLPKKNSKSLFFFNKEELDLASELKIDITSKMIFEIFHQKFIEHINNNIDIKHRDAILKIFDNQDEFNRVISYVNGNEFFMDEKIFGSSFLEKYKVSYYEEFKTKYYQKNSPFLSACKYIGPLLDLFEIKGMKNIDKSDYVTPQMNRVTGHADFIAISLNIRLSPGEVFYSTSSDLLQTEILFGITGKIVRDNPTDSIGILHSPNKEEYSNDAIDLCHSWGCLGFNLNFVLNLPIEKRKIPLIIYRNNLNYDFLKFLKIKHNKKYDITTVGLLSQDRFVEYSIDVKADAEYLSLINEYSKNSGDYEKLLKDYFKLRGIYKGLHNFNQANLIKMFSGLDNKINIIEIALLKGEIIKIHEDLILKKMISDVHSDLKNVKRSYLN